MKINSVNGSNGSASSPTYSFENDVNTGIFSVADNWLGMSSNGTLRIALENQQTHFYSNDLVMEETSKVRIISGTAGAPGLNLVADQTTGLYGASGSLSISTAGVQRVAISSTLISLTPGVANATSAGGGITLQAGDVTGTDANYPGGAINILAGDGYRLSGGGFTSGGPINITAGDQLGAAGLGGGITITTGAGKGPAIGGPSIGTSGILTAQTAAGHSTASAAGGRSGTIIITTGAGGNATGGTDNGGNSGVVSIRTGAGGTSLGGTPGTPGVIEMSPGGSAVGWFSTSGLLMMDGSSSLPSHSFTSDTNTGMYSGGADVLSFATGGTQRMSISSSGISVNSLKITSLGTPTVDTDAATKLYVDNAVAGLSWKNPVKVATTANITLSGTQTIDGVAVVASDRVLVKNQSTASENGIYVVSAGAWTRATDFDQTSPIDEVNSAAVFVMQGTINGDYGFTQTSAVTTVGTDAMAFVQFNGAANLTAGVGLLLTGNVLDVNLGAGIVSLPSDEVGIDLYAAQSLILTTDGTTPSTSTGAKLHLLLDSSTLTQTGSGLKVSTGGINANELASDSVITAKILDANVTAAKLATDSVTTAKIVDGNVTAIKLATDSVTTFKILDDAVTTAKILNGNVTNAKLQNSSITVAADTGSDGVSLGETLTVTGGTGIDTSVAANTLTVTLNANIDDLADVSGCTAAAKGTVLASTGAGAMIPRKIMHKYVGSAATSHVITHGLNQQHCVVTVIETATNEMIIPQSVIFDSTSQLTVSFNASLACTVVIVGLDV